MIRLGHILPKRPPALHGRALFGLIALSALVSRTFDFDRYLEYHRAEVIAGQIWRLGTGHLAHWTTSHLIWDLGAFFLLSLLVLARDDVRSNYVRLVATSVLAISTYQLFFNPHLELYRGLSGVDSALFMFVAANVIREAFNTSDRPTIAVSFLCAIGFIAKISVEASGSGPLFATGMGQDVSMTISAHVIGAIIGLGLAVVTAVSPPPGGVGIRPGAQS